MLGTLINHHSIDQRFAAAADSRGLDRAVRSAQQGSTEDELVSDYGLSRQEAMFLLRLHGSPASATPRRAVS